MTNRPIAPGSGPRLRRYYLILLLFTAIGMPLLILAALAIARSIGEATLTATIGLTAMLIASALLLIAVIRARTSVTTDAIAPPGMRSSGTVAMAAQIIGGAGGAITLVTGLLQHANGVDLGTEMGGLIALICFIPAATAGTVHRLSRRLTN